jgi:hypothetical protein
MSHRKLRLIVSLSIIINVVLSWFLYVNHKENSDIKKGIAIEYSFQQERVGRMLELALENRDNKEKFINYLIRANNAMYHNTFITGNSTPIGEHGNIPRDLYEINGGPRSSIVYETLREAINNELSNDNLRELESYTANVLKISNVLDRKKNDMWNKSLNENYQLLEDGAQLAKQLFK